MRDIRRIFIHCTAGNQKQTLKDLLNEFKAKGWSAPGYHYVVFPDGKVEQLLREDKVSNGVQGYNSTSINVAYVGGIDNQGRATDNRTEEQKASLLDLLTQLKRKYPNAHIMGHRDIWGKKPTQWRKQCPCFDAEKEYASLDTIELEKYSDSGAPEEVKMASKPVENSPVEPKSWLDKVKSLAPWNKK